MNIEFTRVEPKIIQRLCSHNRDIVDNTMIVYGIYEDRDCVIKQCYCKWCKNYHLIGGLKL